jgi:hypothetical protein
MAVLACLRFTRQLLLGSPRAALPSTMHPAAVSSAEPAAPPQQDGLVLPYIRTKSPLKGSGNSSPPPAAVNSPPAARASPRRLLPAAVAAAALADSQAAAASAVGPATLAGSPAAVRGLRPSPFSSGDGDSKNASGKPVAQVSGSGGSSGRKAESHFVHELLSACRCCACVYMIWHRLCLAAACRPIAVPPRLLARPRRHWPRDWACLLLRPWQPPAELLRQPCQCTLQPSVPSFCSDAAFHSSVLALQCR